MKPTLLDWKTTPEEIKDLYINEKWTLRKLARHFKVNRNIIKRYLKKHGITIRTERLMLLEYYSHLHSYSFGSSLLSSMSLGLGI